MKLSTAACAALLCAWAWAAAALEVPLTVEEPVGAARDCEVVSGGIPFPEGKFKDPAAFSLFDGGAEVPVQVSPIVDYPDGSLHWALVSFPVKLGAKEKKTFVLRDGAGKAAPANPVTVSENGDLVEISNGLVTFAVNRAQFKGFELLKVGDKEVFKAARAGLTASGKGGPCKPVRFDFVRRGPLCTTLAVKGTYGEEKTPTWAMTVELRAGEPRLHIEHNLRNGGLGVSKIAVTDPKLAFGLAGDLEPAGGGAASKASKKGPAYGWKVFKGVADLTVFIRHGGPAGGALTHEADVAGGELVVDLAPAKGTEVKLSEGCHQLAEVDLVFGKGADPEALAEPLHALAPCAWYSEHDGLGVGRGFGSLEDEAQAYRNAGWSKTDDPKKLPGKRDADPSIYHASMDVHWTSECDQIMGLVLGYVRTGQRGYLDDAVAWSRYWRTRYMYRTDEFTYGKEARQGKPEKFGTDRTCAGGCHTYGVGIFALALMTGNVDALEVAFELAELANGTDGTCSKVKPGDELGFWGSRSFVRNAQAVIRAYDVARTPEWEERAIHYVKASALAVDRDPRGFIDHGSATGSPESSLLESDKKREKIPTAIELQAKEGTTFEGEKRHQKLRHPTYGLWPLRRLGSWPEAMHACALLDAYRALSASANAEAQLAAEDAMDMAVAKAQLGAYYAFDPVQKAVHPYMFLDYPIPGYAPEWKGGKWSEYVPDGTDSWYTKWWPAPLAAGYQLTGDAPLKERMFETLWWGLGRVYTAPPKMPQGEAPLYAYVESNTKGDWMTPTALAFGVGARPRKDGTPPAAITDLAARSLGGGQVELSWTAPKDEGGGAVARYQVKWATMPMDDYPVDGEHYRRNFKDGQVTVTYWNMASNVLGEPKPQEAGKAETFTVTVPAQGKVWFSVRSFDDSHNRSLMSNAVEVEPK